MKILLSLLAAILLVLFVLGCSEDDENPASSNNPTLSGSWMGKGMLVGMKRSLDRRTGNRCSREDWRRAWDGR